MGQALYRKYRSKSLAELVGQEHITTALGNALKNGRISHAYLLTGPRGTGKTSVARILAHEINGLSYDDEAHLDIIEIDAASNRRIDEIRDLRDRVNTAPSAAKFKVYIIDEVHMLTKEAFNALLKTLEEPPAHVVFILATTEAHKLPETIISRTQRYSFRPVAAEQVIAHLQMIAKKEGIEIDADALALITQHGEGSFRDSISLLDQASNSGGKVSRADVERMLGLAPTEHIAKLYSALLAQQTSDVVSTLTEIYSQGFEPAMVAIQLGERVRSEVIKGTQSEFDAAVALPLLRRLLDVPAARSPKQLLELVLLESAISQTPSAVPSEQPVAPKQPKTQPPAPLAVVAPEPVAPVHIAPAAKSPQVTPAAKPSQTEKTPTATAPLTVDASVAEIWQQTLNEIKKQYNTLYGIARMATPELDSGKLTLHLKFAFHQKRMNEAKNRKILGDVVERLTGQPIEIVCVVSEKVAEVAPKPDVSAISNIFGGAELLES